MLLRRPSLYFAALLVASSLAAQAPSQPTIWASKPDVTAFEKIINDRLAAAQSDIDKITAAKSARTVDNSLALFDEALTQINSANYFAGLMQQVHPDTAFRDRATEMVRKASAAQTALSLNHDVYQALAVLDQSKADAATRYYVKLPGWGPIGTA